ncbi:MAG: AzlD domain-containing protein [Propionibacteriaceae bacterium]|jgi:branched-subunit amino acid transport protein|nr:AzlD domain-containing protein [Propionibacteriaceae bacterium]
MSDTVLWLTIAGAVAVILGTKLLGAYLPERWFTSDRIAPIVSLVTVALLTGLVAVQTFEAGGRLVIDARAAALAVAAIALWRKAPFLLVVILAAATAAGLRYFGLG